MNKKFKILVSSIIIALNLGTITNSVKATEITEQTMESKTQELSSIASDLDPLLVDYYQRRGFTEVVSHEKQYYKFDLKDSSKEKAKKNKQLSIEDYNITKCNEIDLIKSNMESSPMKLARGQVDGLYEETNKSSVVTVATSVFREPSNNNLFSAAITFAWNRSPHINVTDALGIRVSPIMTINKDSCWANAQGVQEMPYNQKYFENILGDFEYKELGAGYEITPKGSYSSNTGFMCADITFSQLDAGRQTGVIVGYYISTSVGADLSIDMDGKPSIGFSSTNNVIEASVQVHNYK